jgi:FkbM family methyltransferase
MAINSSLVVRPTVQPRFGVLSFDRIDSSFAPDGSIVQWEIEGVCYWPGGQVKALELRGEGVTLPATAKLGLPSPSIEEQYPQFPESASAGWHVKFAADLSRQRPWLGLDAHFIDGTRLQIAVLRLVENAHTSVEVPYVSTVDYADTRFRFYVADAGDEIQGRHHARGIFYELGLLEYIRDVCPRGQIVVDAGANVGNHAIFFDKIIGAREVVVFEPNPIANAILLKNIALNDCRNINTRYMGYGLSDRSSRYAIGPLPCNNWGGTRLTVDPTGLIHAVRLDDVLGPFPVALIKIDVEGMEMEVLRGAENLVAAAAPILVVEVTPESAAEAASWLDAHGYRIERTFSMYADIATLVAVSCGIFARR